MKKFRIGVDARILSEPITGIGRYAFEILRRLVLSPHEWYFYSHKPLIVGDWRLQNLKVLSGNYPGRPLRMLWSQTALPFFAYRDRVDLLWSPAHRLPVFLSNSIARVVTIHDLVWKHAPETMRPMSRLLDSRLMPVAVKKADYVISVSRHTSEDIVREIPAAAFKTKSIHLGYMEAEFYSNSEVLKELGFMNPYLLFVGTLEPRKNISRLLEAYSRLSNEIQRKASIVIVGGRGWGGVDVNELITRYRISEHVYVLGYVNDELLSALYSNALFLAMPSLYEGFGLPLLEAISRGTPVLTSNLASMPEVAGQAGYFVDPHDIESIRRGLSDMIENESIRKTLAARCVTHAKNFSWDRTAQETLRVFELAINARQKKIRSKKFAQ